MSKSSSPGYYDSESWRIQKDQVLHRDARICRYCFRPAEHVDHIVPTKLGGNHHASNLVAVCWECVRVVPTVKFRSIEEKADWVLRYRGQHPSLPRLPYADFSTNRKQTPLPKRPERGILWQKLVERNRKRRLEEGL